MDIVNSGISQFVYFIDTSLGSRRYTNPFYIHIYILYISIVYNMYSISQPDLATEVAKLGFIILFFLISLFLVH